MANRHRKKDRFICALCVIMAIVILATAFLLVMELATPYKVSKGFKKEAQASGGGLAVEEITEGNGITLTSYAVQAQADGEEGDPLTIDETHKVIEATVKLSDGMTSNRVKWTLAPKEGETWYEDKAVSDYVELKAASKDNAGAYTLDGLVAYTGQQVEAICIESKQAFGGVLEVTATSADDETKSATVEINYYKAVEDLTFQLVSDKGENVFVLSGYSHFTADLNSWHAFSCTSNRLVPTITYGVGTLEGELVLESVDLTLAYDYFCYNFDSTVIQDVLNNKALKYNAGSPTANKTIYTWLNPLNENAETTLCVLDFIQFSEGSEKWNQTDMADKQQAVADWFYEKTNGKSYWAAMNNDESLWFGIANLSGTVKYVTNSVTEIGLKGGQGTGLSVKTFDCSAYAPAAE